MQRYRVTGRITGTIFKTGDIVIHKGVDGAATILEYQEKLVLIPSPVFYRLIENSHLRPINPIKPLNKIYYEAYHIPKKENTRNRD